MLSRQMKAAFYAVAGPLMTLNGHFYRAFRSGSALKGDVVKLHLGPGQRNYMPGWVNIDANLFTGKCDVWADLRNPPPFPDNSVDAVYSHHMIEHLPDQWGHLRDVFRVLKPSGVYRVGGPSGDNAIAKFMEQDHSWFSDFPDKYDSIGGRFNNFVFCRNEHLTLLTESFLREIAVRAGFTEITLHQPIETTGYPELFADCQKMEHESTPEAPHTLLLEMKKPYKGRLAKRAL